MIVEKDLISKITWRLMPFLGVLYLIAYIDRQNVSFAKLDMVDALDMSEYAPRGGCSQIISQVANITPMASHGAA